MNLATRICDAAYSFSLREYGRILLRRRTAAVCAFAIVFVVALPITLHQARPLQTVSMRLMDLAPSMTIDANSPTVSDQEGTSIINITVESSAPDWRSDPIPALLSVFSEDGTDQGGVHITKCVLRSGLYGLLAGICLAFLHEFVDGRIHRPQDT